MGSNEQQYGYSKPGQMQQAPVYVRLLVSFHQLAWESIL